MTNQEQIYNEAFSLCTKGYRIDTRPGKNKGEYTAYQIRLEDDTGNAELFENLKKAIPESISEQIESISRPHHCIFVAGEDFDLVKGIASCIHISHNAGRFTHSSYLGRTDQEIISDLFPPTNTFKLNHYLRGQTLFISGLGKEHQLVLKRLLGALREINPQIGLGYLVVHVDNADTIPRELANISDVIRLEPEKQAGISQKTKIDKLFYDDARAVLFTEDTGLFCKLTDDEQTLFDYLKKGKRRAGDIIDHFCDTKEFSNATWGRGNFDALKSKLNKKTLRTFGMALVQNVEKGCGEYDISIKITCRKSKK